MSHIVAVQLYTAQNSGWNYDKWGAITFSGDSGIIRVLDPNDHSTPIFEQELYQNFEYSAPRPFFHIFESDDSVMGVSFADESEAEDFYSQVSSYIKSYLSSSAGGPTPMTPPAVPTAAQPHKPPARPPVASQPSNPMPPPPSRPAGPSMSAPAAAPPPAATIQPPPSPTPAPSKPSPGPMTAAANKAQSQPPAVKKEKSGFWSKMSKLKTTFGLEEEASPDIQITVDHSTFRHESHIGWDPANGFEIRNIPPQWRKLFQAAGVKKSELKDAETAKFIMETVAEATVGMNPVAAGNAPPPPPSNHNNNNSAPAPPPPGMGAPPPPGGGPPPPTGPAPPVGGGPPPPGGGPPPSGGGGGGGGGLFAGLGTVQLKKAEERSVPDLEKMNQNDKGVLADTLAKALEQRRDAFQVDSDDFASDDEWSE